MVAYALGAMPGSSIAQAADVIAGETGSHRAIPQLPARGLGSDPVARTAVLLEGLSISRGPRGWRMDARPQLVTRRNADQCERDLDELEAQWGTRVDGIIKQQVLGPWTLLASLELSTGLCVLRDRGAVRDVIASFTEGLAAHIAVLERRWDCPVWIQFEEPQLSAVVRGELRPASTLDPIPAVPVETAVRAYDSLGSTAGRRLLHIPDLDPQLTPVIRTFDTLITRPEELTSGQLDCLAELLDAGTHLAARIIGDSDRADEADECARGRAQQLAQLIDVLGLPRDILAGAVDVTTRNQLDQCELLDAAHRLSVARRVAEILSRDAGDL